MLLPSVVVLPRSLLVAVQHHVGQRSHGLKEQIESLANQNALLREEMASHINGMAGLYEENARLKEQIDRLAKLTEKLHSQNEILIKMNQEQREQMDDQRKATLNFHARMFEEVQDMKKDIREKDGSFGLWVS